MSQPTATNQAPLGDVNEQYPRLGSEFTVRSVITGMLLGGILSLCNIYAGLKIGWGFNVTITAVLLSWAFWGGMNRSFGTPRWGILENNISQTAASSAAAVSSAGLVAPIPALSILTGQTLPWHWLSIWVLAVCLVGIACAIALRRQMLIEEKLPFAQGMATGETLKEIYAHGVEAMQRVKVLLVAAVISIGVKVVQVVKSVSMMGLPGSFVAPATLKIGQTPVAEITLKNLTFGIDPSLMMLGIGSMTGWRSCWSLMTGAVIAWGVIAPAVLNAGWVELVKVDAAGSWYGPLLKWLLWPGVALMVTSSLTSFVFSWRSILATFTGSKSETIVASASEAGPEAAAVSETATCNDLRANDTLSSKVFLGFLGFSLVLSVVLQHLLFNIHVWAAILGVFLSVLLAVVAGRVSGETSVTPVGAMGKVTQLFFGIITPGDPAVNLMAANVTGGAASQCADLLHDLKTGMIVGASPRILCLSQIFGAIAGSLIGSAAYLALVPNPKEMLMTPEWPAPAVAAWLAVAEIFKTGFQAMPQGTVQALIIGGIAGIILASIEKLAPAQMKPYIPSSASLGLAFVIPASNAVMMFLGGIAALILNQRAPNWSAKFLIVVAAGLVAGESLAGVTLAIQKMLMP